MLELPAAAWLLSGRWRFGSWALALAAFATFSLVTFTQLGVGKTECGCFGAVKVPPYFTFVLDVCVTALLLRGRPDWQGWPTLDGTAGSAAILLGVMLAVVGGAASVATVRYGSVQAGIATAAGLPVTVANPTVHVGTVPPESDAAGELEVANLTDTEFQVALITTRCRCAEFHDLPRTVPPGSAERIGVTVRTPKTPGLFRRKGEVKTSAGSATFELVGYVRVAQ